MILGVVASMIALLVLGLAAAAKLADRLYK